MRTVLLGYAIFVVALFVGLIVAAIVQYRRSPTLSPRKTLQVHGLSSAMDFGRWPLSTLKKKNPLKPFPFF